MNYRKNGWEWIPSLYFAEGLPYVMVMTVSVVLYKRLGIGNAEIALYTSWLYLPWVIKPLWSPVVDLFKTKRLWIIATQLIIALGFAGIAFTIRMSAFFQFSLAFFWLMAFASATHDISADGFYMLGLSEKQQSFFVGVRSTFYRVAMITGQGLLVIVAGYFEESLNDISAAWSLTFGIVSFLFLAIFLYHTFILPKPPADSPAASGENFLKNYFAAFVKFFRRREIIVITLFLLFYRFSEAQLVKLAAPFLLDDPAVGGLGLSTSEVGFIYGTVGVLALVFGGILGGVVISKNGLKHWLWWMIAAINLPNALYFLLSVFQPDSILLVSVSVALEQFGYGFGFTAYLLYMIYVSDGEFKTSHYAICTGIMALGMMLPGMVSGWLQEMLGYKWFFVWVIAASIPAFLIAHFVHIDKEFGKRT